MAAQVADELKTVKHATPPMEERRKKGNQTAGEREPGTRPARGTEKGNRTAGERVPGTRRAWGTGPEGGCVADRTSRWCPTGSGRNAPPWLPADPPSSAGSRRCWAW